MAKRNTPKRLPKLLVIVGPTASGKTALAIRLAKRFRAEIVSADSRQLYRGMDIATDIPRGMWRSTGGERSYLVEGVPHHLIACRPPDRPLTAAEYRRLAIRRIGRIQSRGRLPILVGGTGLYIRSITGGFMMPAIAPDPELRRRLGRESSVRLYARLQRLDPAYAARIPSANRRYMIRALEVITKTGRPFSSWHARREKDRFDLLLLGVSRPREELVRRIEARIEEQFSRGLAEEAKRLARRYGWDSPALKSLGHRQLRAHLAGREPLETAKSRLKAETRRYAKRQMTWLRREKGVRWVSNYGDAARLVSRWIARAE
jgi:tRNA dimethylallyltransferase